MTPAAAMHSALYVGEVRHRRIRPVAHGFARPFVAAYTDLDELPGLCPSGGWWRREGPAPVSLRRADHPYRAPDLPLAEAVRRCIRDDLGIRSDGAVRLLAMPRMLGIGYNPVSFAYAFAGDGRLQAVAAEITNTPWLERHVYCVPADADGRGAGGRFAKAFHVSPFSGMDHRWSWRFRAPGPLLAVHMRVLDRDGELFAAGLRLRRRSWTAGNRARVLLRHGCLPALATAAIYVEAWRLRTKGAPVHDHPPRPGA